MNECELVKEVVSGGAVEEFIEECKSGLCSGLSEVCLLNEALSKLIGDGLAVSSVPEHIWVKLKTLVMGYGGGVPLAFLSRALFGVRVIDPDGRELSFRELAEYVKVRGFEGLTLVKYGGACEWLCGYVARLIDDVLNHLSRAINYDLKGSCVNFTVSSYAESLKVLSEYIPEPGGKALRLSEAIRKLCEGVIKLMPGVNPFTTYALIVRFAPIPLIRKCVSECLNVGGGKLVNHLSKLLRPASPALMDLRKCVIYDDVSKASRKDLMKNDYLITLYSRVLRREVRGEGGYEVIGEEVLTSPVYGLIDLLMNQWPEFERSVLRVNTSIKLVGKFIDESVRESQALKDEFVRKFIRRLMYEGEVKITTVPGKDVFSDESIASILKVAPLVTAGLIEASGGWDGVKFGNAVINRSAVRFKLSRAASISGIAGKYLDS